MLVLVAVESDGSDSAIEEIYWEIDFRMQHVPKSERPRERREIIKTFDVSELTVELTELRRRTIDEDSEGEK